MRLQACGRDAAGSQNLRVRYRTGGRWRPLNDAARHARAAVPARHAYFIMTPPRWNTIGRVAPCAATTSCGGADEARARAVLGPRALGQRGQVPSTLIVEYRWHRSRACAVRARSGARSPVFVDPAAPAQQPVAVFRRSRRCDRRRRRQRAHGARLDPEAVIDDVATCSRSSRSLSRPRLSRPLRPHLPSPCFLAATALWRPAYAVSTGRESRRPAGARGSPRACSS